MRLIVLKNNVPFRETLVETQDPSERYEIFVGRADDCHVQIDDPLVSRHHFVIRNEKTQWVCEKLSQLGVVLVNGKSGSQIELHEGDEIKFGQYAIIALDLPKIQPSAHEVALDKLSAVPLPIVEEMPSTVIMPIEAAPKPAPIPDPVLEVGPELEMEEPQDLSLDSLDAPTEQEALGFTEDNATDDFLNESLNKSTESSESSSEEEGEDLFASDSGESQENAIAEFNSEDASTALESFANEGDDAGTKVVNTFVKYQLVLFGDRTPYDRYQFDLDEVFIGRDDKKCQIVLDDPEVSAIHAVIRKKNNEVILEDLNSSNGTIHNGERINKAHLVAGDDFIIGSTTFTLEIRSDLLEAEAGRLMPVEENQIIETEEVHEEEVTMGGTDGIGFSPDAPQEKSIIKRILKDPKKRKMAVYAIAASVMAYVLLYEEQPEESPKPNATKTASKPVENKPQKAPLSKELENKRNMAYEMGVSFFEQSKYFEALNELQTAMEIDPDYKNVQTYYEQTKVALKRLEELEAQKRAEEERIKTKKIIEELLAKAREAVKERQVQVATSYFNQITEKDPENIEVQQLKMELEAWQKEEERKALEIAAKEAKRKSMVDALAPGKTFYLKKEWYRAIMKLEEFLQRKGMDEDLVSEASEMLSDSKNQLSSDIGPLLGKARSFKEGQDLKNAYEAFLEILKVEPTNSEALNEVDDIKFQLETRSKRIYREAIISESLSLFTDAKEKFQEVQQISPTDSEYYRKASDKLKNYLE